jgi:hypothetical protein
MPHSKINQLVTFNLRLVNHVSYACTPVSLCEETVIYDKNEQILSSGELRSGRNVRSIEYRVLSLGPDWIDTLFEAHL